MRTGPQAKRRIKRPSQMRRRRHSCFSDPGRRSSPSDKGLHRRGFPLQQRYTKLLCRLDARGSSRMPSSRTFCAPLPLRSCIVPHSGQRQRGLRSSATAFSTCPQAEKVCAAAFAADFGLEACLVYSSSLKNRGSEAHRVESPGSQAPSARVFPLGRFGYRVVSPCSQAICFGKCIRVELGHRVESPGCQTVADGAADQAPAQAFETG